MDTIGADHGVCVGERAIGKCEGDLPRSLIESHELLVEMDDVFRQDREERVVQIGPMHAKVRSAEQTLRHRQLFHDPAGVPLAV